MKYLDNQSNPINLSISSLPFSLGFGLNLSNVIQFFAEKNINNFSFFFDLLNGKLLGFLNFLYDNFMYIFSFLLILKISMLCYFILRSGHLCNPEFLWTDFMNKIKNYIKNKKIIYIPKHIKKIKVKSFLFL